MMQDILEMKSSELCKELKVSHTTLSRAYTEGRLKAEKKKVGRHVIYTVTKDRLTQFKKTLRSYKSCNVPEKEYSCKHYEICMNYNALWNEDFSCENCAKKILQQF